MNQTEVATVMEWRGWSDGNPAARIGVFALCHGCGDRLLIPGAGAYPPQEWTDEHRWHEGGCVRQHLYAGRPL